MSQFIEKYRDQILGTISGFDRVVFRATPRRLNNIRWDPGRGIFVAKGMQEYLWQNGIRFKNFGEYVQQVSARVKEACLEPFRKQQLPVEYIWDPQLDKEKRARELAAKHKIDGGLICALSAMEMSPTFEYRKSQIACRKRPCQVIYAYQKHAELGFMYARIQTWFPFHIQVGINGREWLARQMDRASIGYRQQQNCFTYIEDYTRAQQLLKEQLKSDWPALLEGFGRQLNPLHEELFERFPSANYWTCFQCEWATDVIFREAEFLKRLMGILVPHAALSFKCSDILRYFGKRVQASGEVPEGFARKLQSNLKEYREGQRVKFWLESNSLKFYDKAYTEGGSVLRAGETMTQKVSIFQAYRPKEGGAPDDLAWRKMRQGIADLHRRAEISQKVNDRLMDALASADDDQKLQELIAVVQQPAQWNKRRVRALQPLGQDYALLAAVNRGELMIRGVRNRDLQAILYGETAQTPQEQKRRSGAISRKIRMLRAHGILRKVSGTHRYHVTSEARTMIAAVLSAARTSLQQINQLTERNQEGQRPKAKQAKGKAA